MERKLAAILSADVKGYSRLIGEDDTATIRTLSAHRAMMSILVQQHGGRVAGTQGDNLLAEFPSVVAAAQCAAEIQRELKVKNAELPADRRVEFRMGINLGEIIVEGEQIHGDGVNIAARLEALAEVGGICISQLVYEQIKNRLPLQYEYVGERTLKNIEKPVPVWRVVVDGAVVLPVGAALRGRPQTRRVGTAHLTRTVLVLAGLLIVGGVVTLLHPSSLPIRIPQSEIRNQASLPFPDKPSIAVLPFVNMSGDPEQEYFSDGITEDLTTALAKVSGLFVIARNSAFVYKGKPVDVKEVSRELGVRYVLEGSVQRADNRVRITAQLVDGLSAAHVWAESYDRELKDIFAVQDEVGQKIVLALKVKLTPEEQERFRRAPTDNLEAYDYYLRGWEYYLRYMKETNAQARQLFEKALALDPQYAGAYAWLGWTYFADWLFHWSQDPQNFERAFELAQRAVALDDSQRDAHQLLGFVSLWQQQPEQALAEAERAIALDPILADGYATLAAILNAVGRPEEAIGLAEKATRPVSGDPYGYLYELGHAYCLTGRDEEAIATLKKLIIRIPNFLSVHLVLAIAYSESGREEEARAEATEVLRISPNFSLEVMRQRWPYKDPAVLERQLAALRKAGLR